jgi:rod shape-determining protein MreC
VQKLFSFLIKNAYLFVFLLLETVSLILIATYNDYPRSVVFSSGNAMVARMYENTDAMTTYFTLRKDNDKLAQENAKLQREVLLYQSILEKQELMRKDRLLDSILPDQNYRFIPAMVIDNNTNKLHNFFTLNKGKLDGVDIDMGVLTPQGVAGIVCAVSDRFAVAISLLNPQIKVSCLVQKSEYVGSLVWDGRNPHIAKLEDISAHLQVEDGDTIVTSGFSSIFPRNIPVGVIERHKMDRTNSYHEIDVRLFTNFKTISHVKVLDFAHRAEYQSLQDSINKK